MYISGENIVVKPYTPVDAYAVMPMAGGIISGGTGDENVTVGSSTRFYWVYDPEPSARNGFTGAGWFCGVQNTPLAGITEEELISEFATGKRTDLNNEFEVWQTVVNAQQDGEDYVGDFIYLILTNGGSRACYSTNA